MILKVTYSTPGLFTMGELRALLAQQTELPDEAQVYLCGTLPPERANGDSSDQIVIEWDEA